MLVLTRKLSESILIGEDVNHVARVPLTPAGGDLVDFEPVVVSVSGAGEICSHQCCGPGLHVSDMNPAS